MSVDTKTKAKATVAAVVGFGSAILSAIGVYEAVTLLKGQKKS